MSQVRAFFSRLGRKLLAMAPILLASAVLFLVCWLLLYLVTPWLPEDWQKILALMNHGDLRGARDRLREILEGTGPWISLAFIGLQALQVIIAPIPGQVAGFVGGYLFGFWHGLFLTMVGLTIGSLIAMSAGRLFGDQVVRRFVPADLMAKLDHLIARGGLFNFLVIFLLPALPDDAVCFVAGLTRFSLWKLMLVMFLGRLPGMAVLCYVGNSTAEDIGQGTIVFAVAMAISAVAWFFSEELEAWLFGTPHSNQADDGHSQDKADELK